MGNAIIIELGCYHVYRSGVESKRNDDELVWFIRCVMVVWVLLLEIGRIIFPRPWQASQVQYEVIF